MGLPLIMRPFISVTARVASSAGQASWQAGVMRRQGRGRAGGGGREPACAASCCNKQAEALQVFSMQLCGTAQTHRGWSRSKRAGSSSGTEDTEPQGRARPQAAPHPPGLE